MNNVLLNNKKIVVAVIDSGIDNNIGDTKDYLKLRTGFDINNGNIIENIDMPPRHEHATAIALIIKDLCNEVEFLSFNILDENLKSDGRLLVHAFKKAIDHKPDIIHLSLGTTKIRYIYSLNKLIRLSEKNNIIVVSALNNSGKRCYPACLNKVIRVCSKNFADKNNFYYHRGKFYAPGSLIDIECQNELRQKKIYGNSMAAAYITGHICRMKYANKLFNIKEIKNQLMKNGEKIYYCR